MKKTDKFAVIGVSHNEEKYGYKIFKHLLESHYNVIGINPKIDTLLNQKIYKNLYSVKEKIDYVIFVIPPEVGEKVLQDIIKLKIKNVWFQPGAEGEKLIQICKENNINYISNACIIKNNLVPQNK